MPKKGIRFSYKGDQREVVKTNINLRHLLAVLEIHQLGSVSSAAKAIHLSQSAVTQGLANLEKQCRAPLFNRTTTGLFATPAGELFIQYVARAVHWLRLAESTIGHRSAAQTRNLRRLLTCSQLRALIAVVESGNYTRASQQLGITQPSVHRAVKELETLCEHTFFQRSPHGVEPSWQARQLSRYASLFFAEVEQGFDALQETQGDMSGTLRIGSLPMSRTRLVPHAVTQLLREFPDTHVHIIDGPYEEQLNALLHGKLDLIVGALRYPAPSADIEQRLLFKDTLNIVVRPDHWLSRAHDVSLARLAKLDWIAPRANTPAREVFRHIFQQQGVEPPEHVIECSSLVAVRGLLLESDRAALLPEKQVEVDVESGLLAISPTPLKGTFRDIGVTTRRHWQPTRVQSRLLRLLDTSDGGKNHQDSRSP